MDRCKGCKHWGGPSALEWWDSTWRYCDRADGIGGDAKYPESLAYATDAEEYGAGLYTSPNFGCVQWDARESAE